MKFLKKLRNKKENDELLNILGFSGADVKILEQFWKEYGSLYQEPAKSVVKTHLISQCIESQIMNYVPYGIFALVYLHCGILSEKHNIYQAYLNYLVKTYPNFYNKNILEVGCGEYPAFVELIATEIHKNKANGTITGIDPAVILSKLDIMGKQNDLYQEEFCATTDISDKDLLLGILPCDATTTIINKACSEEKEMSIMPCKCMHNSEKSFKDYEEYLDYLMNLMNKNKSASFEIEKCYFKKEYNCPPALSLIRK